MLIAIPDVLAPDAVAAARARLDAATWIDGRGTAGPQSAAVKHNEQLAADDPAARAVGEAIFAALAANPLFLSAAMPSRILPPLFNRYQAGGGFGLHVDNAMRVLPDGSRIRTDLSCTLFLSPPEAYDGGELEIEDVYGAQRAKLPAGHLILYPATSLHRVAPVTRGARVAAFFWLQSMIRDTAARALLFDLDQSVQALAAERGLGDGEVLRLSAVYHNLVRMWADP